jgi:hypothetical protein
MFTAHSTIEAVDMSIEVTTQKLVQWELTGTHQIRNYFTIEIRQLDLKLFPHFPPGLAIKEVKQIKN